MIQPLTSSTNATKEILTNLAFLKSLNYHKYHVQVCRVSDSHNRFKLQFGASGCGDYRHSIINYLLTLIFTLIAFPGLPASGLNPFGRYNVNYIVITELLIK